MVMISQRPAEARDRAVPGHWEGDLIIGAGKNSQIGMLTERTTRYTILFPLKDKAAATVRAELAATIRKLPAHLRRSLTWDQGKELAQHIRFTVDTGVQVYFCDPGRPCQRGTAENTIGLVRQYLPKGTNLTRHDRLAHLLEHASPTGTRPPRGEAGCEHIERLFALSTAAGHSLQTSVILP